MKLRLHYAWVIAVMTFLVLLASAGVRATLGPPTGDQELDGLQGACTYSSETRVTP